MTARFLKNCCRMKTAAATCTRIARTGARRSAVCWSGKSGGGGFLDKGVGVQPRGSGRGERSQRKGWRKKALRKGSGKANRKKSKKRVRVEHVFGWMERRMRGTWTHAVGLLRVSVKIGLRNLAYNLDRFACLTKMALAN